MVLLSLSDQDGVIDMTPEAIAGTTGWPLDFIRKGLAELEAPDDRSRTEGEEGRRIIRLDDHRAWGWFITNYKKYREVMRAAERREYLKEKQRERRTKIKASTIVNSVNHVNRRQPIAEAEAEAEASYIDVAKATSHPNRKSDEGCPYQKILDIYHETLPELPKVIVLTADRKAMLRQRWKEEPKLEDWRTYFESVKRSKFLTGKAQPANGKPPFLADLEWLIKPANVAKVIEGKYHRG